MRATLAVLNDLESEGVFSRYAIGGGMAAMFYAEPQITYDLDVFVVPPTMGGGLPALTPIHEALRKRGYAAKHEHVIIEGVPVQFLPTYNPLLEEALDQAPTVEVEGVPTRILRIEHLICIAVQTGRDKDRERVRLLLEEGHPDLGRLAEICARHNLTPPTLRRRSP